MSIKNKTVKVLLASSLAATPLLGQLVLTDYASATVISQTTEQKIQRIVNLLELTEGKEDVKALKNAISVADDAQLEEIFGEEFIQGLVDKDLFAETQDAYELVRAISTVFTSVISLNDDLAEARQDEEYQRIFHAALPGVSLALIKEFSWALLEESSKVVENPLEYIADLDTLNARSISSKAIGNVLAKPEFALIKNGLSDLGLTEAKLIDMKENIYESDAFGEQALDAQNALTKAYAYEYVRILVGGEPLAENTLSVKKSASVDLGIQVKIVGEDAATSWQTVPELSGSPFKWTVVSGDALQIDSVTGTVSGLVEDTTTKVAIQLNDIVLKELSIKVDSEEIIGGPGPITPPILDIEKIVDNLTTPGQTPGAIKQIIKDLSAEDTKKGLEALIEKGKTDPSLLNTISIVAAEYVKKAAKEELRAAIAGNKAEARAGAKQLKSVAAKAVEALKAAKELLAKAGIKDANPQAYLTFEVTNATEDTKVSFSLGELIAAMNGLDQNSTVIQVKLEKVSVSLPVTDILNALTAKASVSAAAENDDYGIQIVQLAEVPSTSNLQAISGVKPIELKVASKDKNVTQFHHAAEVTIEVGSLPKGVDTEKVLAYKLVDGKWIPVGGKYEEGVLTFNTNETGSYGVFVSTKTFADLGSFGWAQKQIEVMAARGIISGRSETKFVPQANVTRAEFASLLVRALGLYDANATAGFKDIKSTDWFNATVASAAKSGIVKGVSEDKFNPNAPITRQEMATMLANALKLNGKNVESVEKSLSAFTDREKIQGWAKESVALAAQYKLVQGMPNGNFAPTEKANRAQAAIVIYNLTKLQ